MIKVDKEVIKVNLLQLINFEKRCIERLSLVLKADLSLLNNSNIMDYSIMLIILHYPDLEDSDYEKIMNSFRDQRSRYKVFVSKNKKYIYCIGIIDYLQQFTMTKFLENRYKSLLYGNDIKYVSAVDPISYCRRMLKFAKDSIFIESFK